MAVFAAYTGVVEERLHESVTMNDYVCYEYEHDL